MKRDTDTYAFLDEAEPIDILLRNGLLDAIGHAHCIERIRNAAMACTDMDGGEALDRPYPCIRHSGKRAIVEVRKERSNLVVVAWHDSNQTRISLPVDGTPLPERSSRNPARILHHALRCLESTTVRTDATDTTRIERSFPADMRADVERSLRTACAVIQTVVPEPDPNSLVRIHLGHPGKSASIVDSSGKPLLRKTLETAVVKGTPAVMSLSSSGHGYVTLEPVEASMFHREMNGGPVETLRILSALGADLRDPVLKAAYSQ